MTQKPLPFCLPHDLNAVINTYIQQDMCHWHTEGILIEAVAFALLSCTNGITFCCFSACGHLLVEEV